MTHTVLVTGSPARVALVSTALAKRDCRVVEAADREALLAVCSSLGPAAVDDYVQLPVDLPSLGDTVVAKFHAFLADGLLARFEMVSAILGVLRPNASVILVSGKLPAELSAPDDTQARMALLQVLARAIRADTAPDVVRTVIMDSTHPADEIADLVVDARPRKLGVMEGVAKQFPEMDYVDWRLEVLSLATIES
jgi:hypothetical protein